MATDSLLQFKLPSIGEGVESADIAEILVAVGDEVAEGDILMELETEKAVVELPSPRAGTIAALHVAPGDTIELDQHLLDFGGDGGGGSDQSEPAGDAAKPAAEESKSATASEAAAAEPPASSSNDAGSPAGGSSVGGGGVVEFPLPEVGEGVESADIAEILVAAGDAVSKDQVIMELETEKAVVSLPISMEGTIVELLVGEGDTVTIGQPLLKIETGAGAAASPKNEADPNLGAAKPAGQQDAGREVSTDHDRRVPGVQRAMGDAGATAGPGSAGGENRLAPSSNGQAGGDDQTSEENALPAPAAPSTRRLARELGVNLRSVSGSGRGGRITQDDVRAHVKQRLTAAPSNLPATTGGGSPAGGLALAPPPLPDFSRFGSTEREKLSKLGRTAAENLTTAWHVIPHVTQQDVADITDLEAARKAFGKGPGANGPKVTMTAIAMKALAKCLQAFPKFNSSLDPETFEIVYKRYYHIGCAVDTPHGLVVPVIRDCDGKSILEIAAELTELAGKARERKLSPDSMQGATCTVTNLGGIGGTGFTPIVNYPEVAILGMSRGEKRLAMQEGQVVERLMLPLSLSYDHRVINGADAAKFVVMFKNLLSDPFQLLAAV